MSKPWDKIRVMPDPLPPSNYPIGPGTFEIGMGVTVKVGRIHNTLQQIAAPGAHISIANDIYWYPKEMRLVAAFLTELADQIECKNG